MCIIIGATAVKMASKFLVVMELMTKQCRGGHFLGPPARLMGLNTAFGYIYTASVTRNKAWISQDVAG